MLFNVSPMFDPGIPTNADVGRLEIAKSFAQGILLVTVF